MWVSPFDRESDEIRGLIVDCVKAIKKKKFSKRQIIHFVALFILKNSSFYFMNYTHNDKNIVEDHILSQFRKMQRIGELKFDHAKNKWIIIPNAEFPTLREDYDGL